MLKAIGLMTLVLLSGGATVHNKPKARDIESLQRVLARMYPLSSFVADDSGICWEFFRPRPDTYKRLGETVGNFKDRVYWSISAAEKGACLRPNSTRLTLVAPSSNFRMLSQPHPSFEEKDWSSLDQLTAHIENALQLTGITPKEFGPYLWNPESHKEIKEYSDFIEPGYQETWLSANPSTLDFSWPSSSSLLLSFGLRKEEWESIFLGDLRVHEVRFDIYDGGERSPYAFDDLLPQYPLLSRLRDTKALVRYEPEEVLALRDECLKLAALAENQLTVQGLDKLVISCSWAAHLKYGIVLAENEEQ